MKLSILITGPFMGFTIAAPGPVTEILDAEAFNTTDSLEERIANTICERYISLGNIQLHRLDRRMGNQR